MDGTVVPQAQATVPLADDGVLRGDAVFEAMLVRQGRTHARDRHLARLHRSALALDLPLDEPRVLACLADLLAAFGPHDGSVRVIVTRGGVVRGLIGPVVWPPSLALAVVEMPWRTALSGVKTLSYAANQWAVRQARARGGDDALVVDDGHVLELPTGAVVLVHEGRCTTPDPSRLPILDSVTVQVLREVAEVTSSVPTMADLRSAEEVLVVSATRPGLPVHRLVLADGTARELPAPGPVTAAIQERLEAHVTASLDGPLPQVGAG
jgi:branched-subunit amino acid aminotransferase/4-amino-4-deoxychorismate lyase